MRHQPRVTVGPARRERLASRGRSGSTPRQTVAFLLAAALVSGGLGTWWLVRSAGRVLDDGLVAVAPLAIGAVALAPAAPRIERDLAAAITAGGALRAVPRVAAHAAWDPQAAPAHAALELAQRTRAGLVVLAQLWPTGADSTRLIARLLDVSHNRVLAMVEVRAAHGREATLGDAAGVQLRAHLLVQPSSSSR